MAPLHIQNDPHTKEASPLSDRFAPTLPIDGSVIDGAAATNRKKRRQFLRWRTPLYDRIFGIGGYLTAVGFGIVTLVVTLSLPDLRNALDALMVVALITLGACLFFLLRLLVEAMDEVETIKRLPAVTEDAATAIAAAFENLARRQSLFAESVSQLSGKHQGGRATEEDWTIVNERHSELMKTLANTAVEVLTTKKCEPRQQCSANIKVFLPDVGSVDDPVYEFVKRSDGSKFDREDLDQKNNRSKVRRHYYYAQLWSGVPYKMVEDVDQEIKDIEILNATRRLTGEPSYDEPSTARVGGAYRSCLIVPIRGDHASSARERVVIGALCIDSESRKHFDSGYDLLVMKQLAEYASRAIRSLYAVNLLREDSKTPPAISFSGSREKPD